MTRQVVVRPKAEDEVLEAREWYETRRSGLGREFAQAVDEIVSRIIEHPLAYQASAQGHSAGGAVAISIRCVLPA